MHQVFCYGNASSQVVGVEKQSETWNKLEKGNHEIHLTKQPL